MFRRAFVLLLLISPACGSRPPIAATPFTEAERQVFDDGVDLVADPELLEGQWRQNWIEEIQSRLGSADYVGIVRVRTLRTDVDLDRKQTFHLVVHSERDLWNYAPSEEFTLSVREGALGYNAIAQNQERLLGKPFVVALKWDHLLEGERPGTLDEIVSRWHLSPASDPIVRRTEFLLARRRDASATRRTRIIERTN